MGRGATTSRALLNVVGVSLKCQIHCFSLTMLDFVVDGLSSIVVFYSVFMHLRGNSYKVQLSMCQTHGFHVEKKQHPSMEWMPFICGVHTFSPVSASGTAASSSCQRRRWFCGSVLDKLPTCPRWNWITFTTWCICTPAHSEAITSNSFQILVRTIYSWKLSCSAAE